MLIGIFVGWRFCNCFFEKRKWEKNLFNIDMIRCYYFLKDNCWNFFMLY